MEIETKPIFLKEGETENNLYGNEVKIEQRIIGSENGKETSGSDGGGNGEPRRKYGRRELEGDSRRKDRYRGNHCL
jgi:hypothetical protein